MASSRVTGGVNQSSGSSGIYFQGDGQSQSVVNSHLSSSFGNLPSSVSGNMNNHGALNGVANSGTSVGGGSLVTDANSGLSGGGAHMQRSASMNAESYNRVPASPLSFSSNNISVGGSPVIDVSSIGQQSSRQDQNIQQMSQSQQQQLMMLQRHQQQGGSSVNTLPMSQPGQVSSHGASNVPSLPMSQTGQMLLPLGTQVPGSFVQDQTNLSPLYKKPRLDIKQEDIMQQQVLQQLLQRQDPMQLQGRSAQLQALFQQQRFKHQHQQLLQSMPQMQRAQLQQQQQQQLQLRQQLQQQSMQPQSAPMRTSEGSVCARRLMQYLYHQRQRPADNSIAYWRKFVAEYYSPRAKQRWCISSYDDVGQHALGVFPQAAMDAWQCDICGAKSGKGFEATFEVLPRLNEIKFGSGVTDELLFLDLPRECKFPSGIMMLEYSKAVQETVYEQLRVVRTGQLRIIFTQDLKILSWEFCTRHHEELLPRRSVAPQVNQLLQVAQKCQNTIAESGSEGVSPQDLQTNSNMVLAAGRQLAKSLELQSLNELGFSKRYVRCLQIAEVVNGMKDLIDFCKERKSGPLDGLKNFPQQNISSKIQMQKMQDIGQLANGQGLPTDNNTLNKLMGVQTGITSQMNNNHAMVSRGALSGSAQAALALTNYQNMLMRQNSINSNPNSVQQDASSLNNPSQSPSSSVQGRSISNLPPSGFPSPHPSPRQPQQLQHRSLSSGSLLQQNQTLQSQQPLPMQHRSSSSSSLLHQNPLSFQGNQALQQHQMIQQLLQEISGNNSGGGVQQQSLNAQNLNGIGVRNGMGFESNCQNLAAATSNASGGIRASPSRSNSFKGPANSETTVVSGNNGNSQKAPDMPQGLPLSDDMVREMSHDFTENGFFNNDIENMGFGWKP